MTDLRSFLFVVLYCMLSGCMFFLLNTLLHLAFRNRAERRKLEREEVNNDD